jgi:hypothetical protein
VTWQISFSPCAALPGEPAPLTLAVQGASLVINGHALDLSFMEEGDRIDPDAIAGEGAELIRGPISLVDGTFRIMLLLLYDKATATDAQRFPEPVIVTGDGSGPVPVSVPGTMPAAVPMPAPAPLPGEAP